MDLPFITIALPAYNAAAVIEDCLASLTAQDYPKERREIIVGDNGSTDDTVEIIARRFPEVSVVSAAQGRGSGYARNAAFRAARGKYICSIDSDCVAAPNWASSLVRTFEACPERVGCLGGRIEPFRVHTPVERWKQAWIRQESLCERRALHYAETPNAVYRRDVLAEVGEFDPAQGFDDTDLGLRIRNAGYEVRYAPDAVVRHRNPATVGELYRHRKKYGRFNIDLQCKYPHILGNPDAAGELGRLRRATARRIVAAALYRFPKALVFGDGGEGTRLWPLLEIVVSYANWVGAREALESCAPKQASTAEQFGAANAGKP